MRGQINKKFLGFIFIILLLGCFVQAKTYEQNTEIDLKVPFEVNGTAASATASCNISIIKPNEAYLKQNESMTNQGDGMFNITLSTTDTSILGQYTWVAFCCDGSRCAAGYDIYEITPSGFSALNSGQGLSLMMGMFSILVLGILCFIATIYSKNIFPKILFGGLGGIFFLIVVLFTLVIFTDVLGGRTNLIEGYSYFWMVIKTLAGISILGVTLFAGWIALRLWQFRRGFID